MKLLMSFVAMATLIGASLWAIVAPVPPYRLSKVLAKVALILGLALLLMGWFTTPALANVHFLKEADQWVYQSQSTLSDTVGGVWEVTVLKPMDEANRTVSLRLETENPGVQLDAAQPLVAVTNKGQEILSNNITSQQFIGSLPDPNVGQYDVRALLAQVKDAQTLRLQLPTQQEPPVTLLIPSELLDEWIVVGSCDYIMCSQL